MYPITDRPQPRGVPPWTAGYRPPDGIVLAGAHGGAGTSTLAALLAPAWDMGTVGGTARAGGLRPGRRPVVLAVRNTVPAAGTPPSRAARHAAVAGP